MGAGRWFKNGDGSFSAKRTLGALLLLAIISTVATGAIATALGSAFWLATLLVAVVNATVALALVVSPLARGY